VQKLDAATQSLYRELAMKRISKNLARHDNGTYYLDIKRGGRQIRRSLDTANQRETKRRLKVELERIEGESTTETRNVPIASAEFEELKALITKLQLNGSHVGPTQTRIERPAFAEAIENHFPTINTESPRTLALYLTQKRKLLRLCKNWDEFDPARIWGAAQRELRQSVRKRPDGWTHSVNNGASSLNMLVHYQRNFCAWLKIRGWLDPAVEHSLNQLKLLRVSARRMEPPTAEEMAALIAQIKAENYSYGAFVAFLAYTGCRVGEALGARWEDWSDDQENPKFTFREKGRITRTINLTAQANDLLKEIRARGGIKPANKDPKWKNGIFPFGDSRINKTQRLLKKRASALELPTTFFHSLRHYFACQCIMSGLGEYTVARLIGDTVEMVRMHYGHLRSDHVRDEVKKIKV
jgi:integrase